MEIFSKAMESHGSGPTEAMKKAMNLGNLYIGLNVTFLNDSDSLELPFTTVTAGSILEIIGMIQSSENPDNWTVELGLETDDCHNMPIIFTLAKLLEVTDLQKVLLNV